MSVDKRAVDEVLAFHGLTGDEPGPEGMTKRELFQHLLALEAEGKLERAGLRKGRIVWRATPEGSVRHVRENLDALARETQGMGPAPNVFLVGVRFVDYGPDGNCFFFKVVAESMQEAAELMNSATNSPVRLEALTRVLGLSPPTDTLEVEQSFVVTIQALLDAPVISEADLSGYLSHRGSSLRS